MTKRSKRRCSGKRKLPSFNISRYISVSWRWVGIIAVILTVVTSIYSWSARVEVDPESPLRPQKPFSAPFRIKNCGWLPIYDIQYSCIIRQDKRQNGGVINIRTRVLADPIERIDAGESDTTFFRSLPYKTKIESADIEAEVHYRPAYLPWSKTSPFRFVTVIQNDGTFRWVPRARSE